MYGKLTALWPVVVALIGMVVVATTVKNRVDDHEARIQRLEFSMSQIQNDTHRLVDELLEKK